MLRLFYVITVKPGLLSSFASGLESQIQEGNMCIHGKDMWWISKYWHCRAPGNDAVCGLNVGKQHVEGTCLSVDFRPLGGRGTLIWSCDVVNHEIGM
jgi:hypothetical protein